MYNEWLDLKRDLESVGSGVLTVSEAMKNVAKLSQAVDNIPNKNWKLLYVKDREIKFKDIGDRKKELARENMVDMLHKYAMYLLDSDHELPDRITFSVTTKLETGNHYYQIMAEAYEE